MPQAYDLGSTCDLNKKPKPRKRNTKPKTGKEPTFVEIDDFKQPPPAADPVAREKQLINLAVNLAEKQLRDGTASASTINHYLKLASTREQIEREILEKQAALMAAKADAINGEKQSGELYKQALEAMTTYGSSQSD